MAERPGKGLLGWLGRQIGHVSKAVHTDVTKPAEPKKPSVLYRADTVEEADHPENKSLKLRRTTIDEVIEVPKSKER